MVLLLIIIAYLDVYRRYPNYDGVAVKLRFICCMNKIIKEEPWL